MSGRPATRPAPTVSLPPLCGQPPSAYPMQPEENSEKKFILFPSFFSNNNWCFCEDTGGRQVRVTHREIVVDNDPVEVVAVL